MASLKELHLAIVPLALEKKITGRTNNHAAFCLSGCYGDIRDYCEGEVKCEGGNDADEDACVEWLKGQRKAAKDYDCRDKFDEWIECAADKYKCEDDWWTDNGKCDKQYSNLWDCIDKSSGLDYW